MAAMGRSRGWAGPIGFAVLLLVGIGCFATLPWTLGGVEFAGVVERRYEAGDLDLNLLPRVASSRCSRSVPTSSAAACWRG
jgi:hypothetical protein